MTNQIFENILHYIIYILPQLTLKWVAISAYVPFNSLTPVVVKNPYWVPYVSPMLVTLHTEAVVDVLNFIGLVAYLDRSISLI